MHGFQCLSTLIVSLYTISTTIGNNSAIKLIEDRLRHPFTSCSKYKLVYVISKPITYTYFPESKRDGSFYHMENCFFKSIDGTCHIIKLTHYFYWRSHYRRERNISSIQTSLFCRQLV